MNDTLGIRKSAMRVDGSTIELEYDIAFCRPPRFILRVPNAPNRFQSPSFKTSLSEIRVLSYSRIDRRAGLKRVLSRELCGATFISPSPTKSPARD
jgi:hypothetical protein